MADGIANMLDSNWARLPKNLLNSILDSITSFSDYVNFCAVCKYWRSVAMEDNHYNRLLKQKLHLLKTCRNQLPLLMVPTIDNNKDKRGFYSITEKVVHHFGLPVPCESRCFGSSHGWLFTINKSMAITLLNPFTDKVIYLPEFKDPEKQYQYWVDNNDPAYYIKKGILSSDPSLAPNNYEVAVIYEAMRRLAIYKSGEETWTFLDLDKDYVFSDITYHDNQLYGVNNWCTLVRVDVASGVGTIVINAPRVIRDKEAYLVNSLDGDLLQVRRFQLFSDDENAIQFKTRLFEVFKLNKTVKPRWVQVKSIGDQALFLGDNDSLSVSTLDFGLCKSNCIYYVDHILTYHNYVCQGANDDSGIFNLEDGSFDFHYVTNPSHLLPAIWIVPNFKEACK